MQYMSMIFFKQGPDRRVGCIKRYTVDEVENLRIVHWHDHQASAIPRRAACRPSVRAILEKF